MCAREKEGASVCVREKDRYGQRNRDSTGEREREIEGEKERERERHTVCVRERETVLRRQVSMDWVTISADISWKRVRGRKRERKRE